MKRSLLPFSSAVCAGLLTLPAVAQVPWSLVYDGDHSLNAAAYGGGQFVVVGDAGTVLTSPTGEEWTPRTIPSPAATRLQSVTHGDGLWVVGGRTDGVLTSSDGIRWAWISSSPAGLTALAYGGGVFVGTGSRLLWVSTNGVQWTSINPGASVTDRVLTYGNGRFVAVGMNQGSSRILSSSDGLTWEDHPAPSSMGLYSLAFGDGRYLAIDTRNQAFTTDNLEVWTPGGYLVGIRPVAVAHGLGVFVAAGSGNPEMSVDGSAWTFGGSEDGRGPVWGIAFGTGSFIAVGFQGTIRRSTNWLLLGTTAPGDLSLLGPGGGQYSIEARDSLNAGTSWLSVGNVTVGTNAATWVDPGTSDRPARWYRAVGP